ncbi:MAG: T9SS type A sorting domain-containing protein [Candidatus Azobacteroides sp.]|nr:T9SS type A sorting domain-containing protein [Candidatus Azobacteroides sp.]
MKKINCLLVSILFSVLLTAQTQYVEYFIDTDPGRGNGIKAGQPGTSGMADNNRIEELSFTVSLSDLSDGFHLLYLRALSQDNRWSQLISRPFIKAGLPHEVTSEIKGAEYYIDTDPGEGKGIPVIVSKKEADINLTAILTDISLGSHTIHIRGKNKFGNWIELGTHFFAVVTASIHEKTDNRITLYPNPVVDMLFVRNDELSVRSVTLSDSNGIIIIQKEDNLDMPVIPFSLEAFPSGIYFVRLETEKENKTIKIIKR